MEIEIKGERKAKEMAAIGRNNAFTVPGALFRRKRLSGRRGFTAHTQQIIPNKAEDSRLVDTQGQQLCSTSTRVQ